MDTCFETHLLMHHN